MKKLLLPLILIVTLLSNITISYAQGNQGNQPFWKINGNSNISSENFMGTLNNQDLVIKTNNIRRVIIQKDGLTLFKDKVTVNGIGYFKNRLIVDDVTKLKNKLIVDSNAVIKGKIKNNYLSGSGIVLLKADNNGIIKKFPFPGDSTKVLRGDGTFSSFSAGITGSENNTVYFNTEGKQQESDALTNDGTDIKVKNGLTIGERSGATGQFSMVVGGSGYGLAAPEASNGGAFAQGCNTKATGLASFSTGVSTKATGMASFSTGINTIASGESSFAGGHDDAGGNRFVVASGKGAFNYSAIGSGYIRVGAAAENSAILGGKNNSIDSLAENSGIFCGRNNTIFVSPTQVPPMQTVIIGGENIIATEPNTVYVPDLIAMGSITAENMNVTGQTVFDSLQVNNKIKIGNSIVLDSEFDPSGYLNSIYTDDISPLYIQSNDIDHNTIINAKNKGLVGIGTTEPTAKLNITGIVFEEDPKPLFRITENTGTIMPPFPPSANIFEIRKKTNAMTPDGQIVYSYALTVADTGSVGIGTNNPLQRLHVNGNGYFTGRVGIGINSNDPHLKLHVNGNSYFTGTIRTDGDRMIINGFNGADNFWFRTAGPEPGSVFMAFEGEPDGEAKAVSIAPGGIPGMYIKEGRVGIRTMEPSANLTIVGVKTAFNVVEGGNNKFYIMSNGHTWINNKLYVEHDADTSWAVTVINNANNGKGLLIKAGKYGKGIEIVNSDDNKPIFLVDIETQKTFMRGFKSTIQDFPDYVLEENYNLMPLKEKEKYWKQHKHLLGFPTAKEVKQGVDIPELITKQMKEIEELYLHLVELKKENDELKQRIELLEQKK